MSGLFVVVEGGESSGKSTQARMLADRLRDAGREVVLTYEPGATERGAQLRAMLLDDHSDLDERAELLLVAADRAQHVAEVIRPALASGAIVVCDRFTPSTLVYQGVARGLGVDAAERICAWAAGDLVPHVVIVLDVGDDVAARRSAGDADRAADRVEAAGEAFHRAVRQAYRDLASERGWLVVDGSGTPGDVADAVWASVSAHL